MASSKTISRVYPKRKRAVISYYDDDSDGSGFIDVESEVDSESEVEGKPAKKVSHLCSILSRSTIATDTCQKVKGKNSIAVAVKPALSQKTFKFMELPGELKNKIYEQALKHYEPIILVTKIKQFRHVIQIGKDSDFERSLASLARPQWGYMYHKIPYEPAKGITKPFIVPSLLAVSRQVYAEAQPLLYGANVFIFKDPAVLHIFCAKIGPRNCAALKELVMKEYGYSGVSKAMNHAAFTLLASAGAVNLSHLHLDCPVHGGGGKMLARRLMKDAHCWFDAVGVAKGKRDAALDVLDVGLNVVVGAFTFGPSPTRDEAMAVRVREGFQAFQTEMRILLEMGS